MIGLLLTLALGVDYISVHSDKTLDAAEYASLPFFRLLTGADTKQFMRPVYDRLESRRADDLPPDCSKRGAVYIEYDVASRLTALAKKEPKDERLLRILAAVGLGDATIATLCLEPHPQGLSIRGFLSLRRYTGFFATLQQNDVPADAAVANHYWSASGHVAWPDAWTVAKQLDRAAAGTRGARLDAMLQAGGTLLDANVERALITPLTGRATTALITDPKTRKSAHVMELGASETAQAAALAALIEEVMPRADLGRKREPNEWGFIGAMSGVGTLGGALFVKLFEKRMVYAEDPFALDAKPAKVPSAKLPPGAFVYTIDLAKYRALYERVGRPADTKELVNELHLSDYVDIGRAPHPKLLFQGVERMTLVVGREDAGLRLSGLVFSK